MRRRALLHQRTYPVIIHAILVLVVNRKAFWVGETQLQTGWQRGVALVGGLPVPAFFTRDYPDLPILGRGVHHIARERVVKTIYVG